MHVSASGRSGSNQTEIRVTIEAMIDLANGLTSDKVNVREVLVGAGFTRAPSASNRSLDHVASRLTKLLPLFQALPESDVLSLSRDINQALTALPISPSIVEHDGNGPHIHWTPTDATFDDQVLSDILMALTQELCDNGTSRFGRCGASDCEDLFYDATRNRSRRFCANPRCATRTHTADHRARRRRAEN